MCDFSSKMTCTFLGLLKTTKNIFVGGKHFSIQKNDIIFHSFDQIKVSRQPLHGGSLKITLTVSLIYLFSYRDILRQIFSFQWMLLDIIDFKKKEFVQNIANAIKVVSRVGQKSSLIFYFFESIVKKTQTLFQSLMGAT